MLAGDAAAAAAAAASGTGPIVILIERLLVLKEYRSRGYAKGVLSHALADAAARIGPLLSHERPLAKACMFIPSSPKFLPAAKAALAVGMTTVGATERPVDPTGRWELPVWEFSIEPPAIGALVHRLTALIASQSAAHAQMAAGGAGATPPAAAPGGAPAS
jgi:hypothetical protein